MSPPPIDAQPPFNQSSADITLRTSDHVDFHVHSVILSQASTFFATMFQLPQPKLPSPSDTPNRSVVDVAEDSVTLDTLLRLCYPVKSPVLGSAEAIEPVLKAALKYDMEWPTEVFTERLLALLPGTNDPLRFWAIGCRLGLEDVARRGVEALLRSLPESDPTILRVLPGISRACAELEGVTAGDYWRCLSYINRRRAGEEPFCPLLQFSDAMLDDLFARPGPKNILSMLELPFFEIPDLDPGSQLPNPDIVCTTSEGDALRVHQTILSLYSPVFRERILALKAATHSNPDTVLTLDTDLSPRTLYYVLQICYEGEDCLPSDPTTLSDIYRAAKVYQMKRVIQAVEPRWRSAMKVDPWSGYFIAEGAGLSGFTQMAARFVVDDTARLQDWYGFRMNSTTARGYHRLLTYHASCRIAVREELRRAKERWEKTVVERNPEDVRHSTWVTHYIDKLEETLQKEPAIYHDCLDHIFRHSTVNPFTSPGCRRDAKRMRELYEFMRMLPQKIEAAIDQVEWKF